MKTLNKCECKRQEGFYLNNCECPYCNKYTAQYLDVGHIGKPILWSCTNCKFGEDASIELYKYLSKEEVIRDENTS